MLLLLTFDVPCAPLGGRYFIVDEPLSPREKDSGAVVSRVASRLDALIPRVS